MNGAPPRYLQYAIALLVGNVALQHDAAPYLLVPGSWLAAGAGHAPVAALDLDAFDRPALPPRIQEDRHGRSGAERR